MRIRTAVWALLLGAVLAPHTGLAQKEYNVWCMGDHAGLDFNGAVPAPASSGFNTSEACASTADPTTGLLLFYSGGEKVYNRDHVVMPNGDGLISNVNSTQGALIVPMPGNPRRYYLFTSDAGDYDTPPNMGVHYSIIDMAADGGRGDVVTKNIPMLATATEKLTAVRHADGCGFWVLCHGWNDSMFYAYLVDDAGIAAPVLSATGSVHRDPPLAAAGIGTIGYMKSSIDGKRLAVAQYGGNTVEIFDFDDRTGRVSNPLAIPFTDSPYGVAFSPDNTKLYVSCGLNALYQFDLADPTPAAILASRVLISNQVDATVSERYGALQLAPDGRIYHAHAYTQWVGAIHDPNAKGAACNYVFHEMNLGAAVLFGLPNLIDGFFATGSLACGAPAVSFTPGDTTICAGSCLDFTDMSTNNPTSWNWSFPGANRQSSTAQHPAGICYDAPGTYRVTLHASNARGAGSWSRDVVVAGRGDLKAHFGGSYSVAPGDTLNVPLVLDAPVDAARLAELKVTVDYGAGMLHLDTIDPSRGVLAGWTIDSLRHDRAAGRCTLYVSAAPGAYLQGTGTLADLRFRVFLGQSDTAELRFDISSLANRCLGAGSEPGRAVLAICDARNRLIEIGASSFALDANRPNPFNPSTTIPYSIGLGGHVTLTIRDALGRIVATLVDGDLAAGSYIARWDAASAPSGIYFYAIETGPWRAMRRMVLVK